MSKSVDDFVISMDTSDPETFTYLRGGAKLSVVMQNLERGCGYETASRVEANMITLHFTLML